MKKVYKAELGGWTRCGLDTIFRPIKALWTWRYVTCGNCRRDRSTKR